LVSTRDSESRNPGSNPGWTKSILNEENLIYKMSVIKYNGQAEQDKFVLNVMKHKHNGYFLEIGSNHPIQINNSYILESCYDWKGIMIEYEAYHFPGYKTHRPNSVHVHSDATKVDYKALFESNNVPTHIDYLQIDLEANMGTTISTLEKLDKEVMDNYKFAVVTFEHDIYRTSNHNTRGRSRNIFIKRGYYPVFYDVNNMGENPFEDWYVHPDLVDMNYIQALQRRNQTHYRNVNITRGWDMSISSINWQNIKYE
jgi:hypothetical protein